jgi:molybdopterin converting factor small subunit
MSPWSGVTIGYEFPKSEAALELLDCATRPVAEGSIWGDRPADFLESLLHLFGVHEHEGSGAGPKFQGGTPSSLRCARKLGMATVQLSPRLRELTSAQDDLEIDGGTVGDVLRQLEQAHPQARGWVLDEQGNIRHHVKIFVNGDMASLESSVSTADRVHIVPAISGGSDDAELLIGTRKGLFVLRGPRGGAMEIASRHFSGQVVEYAMRDSRTGTYFASVTDGQFGPRIYMTDDFDNEWTYAQGPEFPPEADASLSRTWVVVPGVEDNVMWAGVAPAALFKSEDSGRSWSLNEALWNVPSRPDWQPGAGGLALHSICTWPGDPNKMAVGISAAGVWLSEDGGQSWERGIKGIVPRYLPEEAREEAVDLCVHNMHRAPLQPETLYMQFHGGVFRSDDAGATWNDIASETELPSDFGFPMVVDPRDPDRAFVIPLVADYDRVTPDGAMRVFETRDRGASWQSLGKGLPESDAYLTILRQAFCHDGLDPLGLYFGAESGEVFGTADDGMTWNVVAEHLAPVTSVRCA